VASVYLALDPAGRSRLHCDKEDVGVRNGLRNKVLTDKDGCRLRWKGLGCAETVSGRKENCMGNWFGKRSVEHVHAFV
jgi:hypothetical protein